MSKTNSKKLPARPVPVSTRRRVFTEVIGWYGAASVLIAYALVTFNLIDVHGLAYTLLNLSGALGILTIATAKHVRQSMLVNGFWAAMAALALVKIVLKV